MTQNLLVCEWVTKGARRSRLWNFSPLRCFRHFHLFIRFKKLWKTFMTGALRNIHDWSIVPHCVICFYGKVGKRSALTNVKSDRGFKSWPGHEVKPPDYHSSLEAHGQLDYQPPPTYLGDEQDLTHPSPGSFRVIRPPTVTDLIFVRTLRLPTLP